MSPEAVVKLGGSYWASPLLAEWLSAVSALAGRIVLVPGGGPFADAVRHAQPRMGFDDRAAHVMALLAMEQYAHALASLCPALAPAASLAAMRRALAGARVPVWCPAAMALRDSALAPSWSVTSDTLAVWLAGRLGAKRLVLVKHVAAPASASPADLSRQGILDEAFPAMQAGSGVPAHILGPGDHARLAGVVAAHA